MKKLFLVFILLLVGCANNKISSTLSSNSSINSSQGQSQNDDSIWDIPFDMIGFKDMVTPKPKFNIKLNNKEVNHINCILSNVVAIKNPDGSINFVSNALGVELYETLNNDEKIISEAEEINTLTIDSSIEFYNETPFGNISKLTKNEDKYIRSEADKVYFTVNENQLSLEINKESDYVGYYIQLSLIYMADVRRGVSYEIGVLILFE